jgi:hypothetical protein
MRVQFPKWPVWNYHFPQIDVRAITSVLYINKQGSEQTLDPTAYRLSIGRNGVSGIQFLAKPQLPELADRTDAVAIYYDV